MSTTTTGLPPDDFQTLRRKVPERAKEAGWQEIQGTLNRELDPHSRAGDWNLNDEQKFTLFADVVTKRWLYPKPEDWYPVPDHALDWHDHLHDGDYAPMILSGRKHTKTTWALCEILYACQYTPHYGVLYWCNNAENQLPARMAELEEMVESNLWLDGLHKGNPDHQNNVPRGIKQKDFPNGSTVYATGVGGGIEGSHVNLIVGDDPLKEMGDVADEDIVQFYNRVIVPMADGADRLVIIGTRKRPKDIYHLISEDGYRLIEYPAVREPWEQKYGDRSDHLADADLYRRVRAPELALALGLDAESLSVLWPEARGPDFLASKLGLQGKAAFVREWCMVFTHVEDAIIRRDWVESGPVSIQADAPDSRKQAEAYLADYLGHEGFEFDRVAVGLDPAVVEGGDNCAWAVVGAHGEHRYVLHVEYINGIHPERMRETTAALHDRYEADVIVAEKNGLDWYMDRHVKFPPSLPIRKHNTGAAKHSWTRGVPAIADAVERGLWRFFREDDNTESLIDGLCSLRMDDNDHLAGHTPDVVMALYMATKGLATGSGVVLDYNERGMTDDEVARYEEHVEQTAETEAALEESEVGRAILGIQREREELMR